MSLRVHHLIREPERWRSVVRGIGHTLAQVARLSFPYFRSKDCWAGRGLLGAILGIELAQVGIAVLLNSWNARFYDALQHKNASAFGYELLVTPALIAAWYEEEKEEREASIVALNKERDEGEVAASGSTPPKVLERCIRGVQAS